MTAQLGDARLPDRFWQRVRFDAASGCWIWTGRLNRKGYGFFDHKLDERWIAEGAHRVAYRVLVGPIPGDREIDHVQARGCRSRACVNPARLEAVTHRVNLDRGAIGSTSGAQQRAKTHCPHGHEYTPENTAYVTARRWRQCRTCIRSRARARRAAA